MKKYFFVPGNNFELSLAELLAVFPAYNWQKLESMVVFDLPENLDFKELIKNLGGIVKIGEIIKDFSLADRRRLSEVTKDEIISIARELEDSSKFNFGFSFYNQKSLPGDFFKLGLSVKKDLKNLGISSRMVMSKEPVLSSVVVEQNRLIKDGLELCFFVDKNKVFLGKTLAVQDFKGLSKRDFGRPNRDDHSGMIPPKLAQIMINLARRDDENFKSKTILDPFCGSGTILMESYLLGFKNIIGTDLSDKAVFDSVKNINWIIDLNEEKSIETCGKNIDIFQSNVLDLNKNLDNNSIDYVVCEPYLGPQRGFKDFSEVTKELNLLYSGALDILFNLIKPGGRVVMIWPQFRAGNKTWKLNPKISKFVLKPTLDAEGFVKENSGRKTLIYGREEQKVWREIVVLEKK